MLSAFRTDTDISKQKNLGRERDLQAWAPSGDAQGAGGALGDEETFGSSAGQPWDQFTANEQLFGVKASFDENVYTTKIDRNAPDFKEREKKAQRIAAEILAVRLYLHCISRRDRPWPLEHRKQPSYRRGAWYC